MSLDQVKLLHLAYDYAAGSRDPSTQNGALLVDDEGTVLVHDINRFPQHIAESDKRWERPLKYKFIEHAERNVCYAAAREGIATKGLTMVCPWAACADCARAIIQSGIKCLVTHKQAHDKTPEQWKEEIAIALSMLEEAGVEVVMYDGEVGASEVLHSEELWNP